MKKKEVTFKNKHNQKKKQKITDQFECQKKTKSSLKSRCKSTAILCGNIYILIYNILTHTTRTLTFPIKTDDV